MLPCLVLLSISWMLASGASLPSRTAGTIFYIYVSGDAFWPRDCPRATHKRNRPCLFRSPSMHSIQLAILYIHKCHSHKASHCIPLMTQRYIAYIPCMFELVLEQDVVSGFLALSMMPGSICLKHPVKPPTCNHIYVHTSEKNFQNISISKYSPIATAARSGST